jgi:hypothetical protein
MDVIDQAQSALSNSPIHALRRLRVQRDGACLILSGCVDSFYHKQMAQEVVRIIAQDMRVVNIIDVCYDSDPHS